MNFSGSKNFAPSPAKMSPSPSSLAGLARGCLRVSFPFSSSLPSSSSSSLAAFPQLGRSLPLTLSNSLRLPFSRSTRRFQHSSTNGNGSSGSNGSGGGGGRRSNKGTKQDGEEPVDKMEKNLDQLQRALSVVIIVYEFYILL